MQLQSTISLCKLLSGENKVKEYSNLRKSLKTITSHSQVDPDRTLGTMIENGINQISRLLRFNEQLAENDHNPEVMAELIYKIADSYAHSPNLRITWLEALATHHSDVIFISFPFFSYKFSSSHNSFAFHGDDNFHLVFKVLVLIIIDGNGEYIA